MIDPFEIPKTAVPEWVTYRWVRKSIHGQADTQNIKEAERDGWRAVPRVRHWNVPAYESWDAESEWAEYGGLVLMERPDHMTLASQAENRRKAFELHSRFLNAYQTRGSYPDVPLSLPPEQPKRNIWQRVKRSITSTLKGVAS